jgi:hypothetical protein
MATPAKDWQDMGRRLNLDEIKHMLRDAALHLGKADENDDPSTFCDSTIAEMQFDTPPLPSEPHLEREAFYYFFMTLFKRTKCLLAKKYFSYTKWMDARPATKLSSFATTISQKTAY